VHARHHETPPPARQHLSIHLTVLGQPAVLEPHVLHLVEWVNAIVLPSQPRVVAHALPMITVRVFGQIGTPRVRAAVG
jgi:hypothetical protein